MLAKSISTATNSKFTLRITNTSPNTYLEKKKTDVAEYNTLASQEAELLRLLISAALTVLADDDSELMPEYGLTS